MHVYRWTWFFCLRHDWYVSESNFAECSHSVASECCERYSWRKCWKKKWGNTSCMALESLVWCYINSFIKLHVYNPCNWFTHIQSTQLVCSTNKYTASSFINMVYYLCFSACGLLIEEGCARDWTAHVNSSRTFTNCMSCSLHYFQKLVS